MRYLKKKEQERGFTFKNNSDVFTLDAEKKNTKEIKTLKVLEFVILH